jgi:hypothetical protein
MNHEQDEKDTTIILTFIAVIENHMLNNSEENKDYKVELLNKEIIKQLNQLFNIRESFEELLEYAVNNINQKIGTIDYDTAKNYIESLFGYRTNEQLLNVLKHEYGEDSKIAINENNVKIETSTDNITKYLKLNELPIIEIRKYFKNNNVRLDNINIMIKNLKTDYPSTADPINILEYVLNEESRKYYQKIIRKSGIEDNIKEIKI